MKKQYIHIDYGREIGAVKRMNAVNNGPVYELHREKPLEKRNNLELYKSLNIPYARLHDAPYFSGYGGDHTVDVHLIFRDFDADPYDPDSYDFACTDQLMKVIMMAGTKPFYRLGCSIEGHLCKKYAIYPPKDYQKWAVICEHIIAHFNEGWADGYNMNIEYWEIWNEPNAVDMWLGTPEQYYELYVIAAKHLKARFPSIKVGGPAVCNLDGIDSWVRPFLEKVRSENAPLDFFSWHGYTLEMDYVIGKVRQARKLLDEYGFTATESILNEWNYAKDFSVQEAKVMLSIKGAAFTAAYMSVCQDGPLDMLMYYDARPTYFNNLFDMAFLEPLKGYYVHRIWGEMLKNAAIQCKADCDTADIYITAAKSEADEYAVITYYTDKQNQSAKELTVELANGNGKEKSVYLLDESRDMAKVSSICAKADSFCITLEPNTVAVIR